MTAYFTAIYLKYSITYFSQSLLRMWSGVCVTLHLAQF